MNDTCKILALSLLAALPLLPQPAAAQYQAIETRGGLTAVWQQELDSGAAEASLSADFFLTYPTDAGRWFLYIEGASGTDETSLFNLYPEVNGDANSVLDRNGGSHVQVSELYYRFNLGERSQLMVGQIDTSAQIDRSRISNDENTQFLGVSFVNNPTIVFPDYTLGLLYRRLAVEREPELTVILTSSDGIADNPSRSYSELIDVTGDGKGIFTSLSARWFRGRTEYGMGVWLRTDDHPLLDNPADNDHNRGAYVVYGVASGDQTLNFRAGMANRKVARAARFAAVSYELRKPHGTLGLGLARIFEASRAQTANSGDTAQAEAWYRVPLIANHLHLTADAQYVSNPGFDASGTVAERHALLAGLRLDYVF
jgi:hypothetical protein